MDPGLEKSPRILIVAGEPEDGIGLEAVLKDEQYDVVSAASGEAALEAVEEQTPDLILLDLQLPGMDGYEVCERLRDEPATELVPVIMFTTAETASEARAKGLPLGVNDYVTRPVVKEDLIARIETQLRLRELENRRMLTEQLNLIKQMINTLHHEIINPLTGILGHSEVLLDRMSKKVVSLNEIERSLQTIWEESLRIQEVMVRLKEVAIPGIEEESAGGGAIDDREP
jgi:DNA-binding response OmpR family regulator